MTTPSLTKGTAMPKLSPEARRIIRGSGLTVAGYTRHHFVENRWYGDACGCIDDRCAGHHHLEDEACGCLPVLIDEFVAS